MVIAGIALSFDADRLKWHGKRTFTEFVEKVARRRAMTAPCQWRCLSWDAVHSGNAQPTVI
jgi:hypothetical protein